MTTRTKRPLWLILIEFFVEHRFLSCEIANVLEGDLVWLASLQADPDAPYKSMLFELHGLRIVLAVVAGDAWVRMVDWAARRQQVLCHSLALVKAGKSRKARTKLMSIGRSDLGRLWRLLTFAKPMTSGFQIKYALRSQEGLSDSIEFGAAADGEYNLDSFADFFDTFIISRVSHEIPFPADAVEVIDSITTRFISEWKPSVVEGLEELAKDFIARVAMEELVHYRSRRRAESWDEPMPGLEVHKSCIVVRGKDGCKIWAAAASNQEIFGGPSIDYCRMDSLNRIRGQFKNFLSPVPPRSLA